MPRPTKSNRRDVYNSVVNEGEDQGETTQEGLKSINLSSGELKEIAPLKPKNNKNNEIKNRNINYADKIKTKSHKSITSNVSMSKLHKNNEDIKPSRNILNCSKVRANFL